jgi:hypothetical protein
LAKQKFKDFVPAQLAWGALSETSSSSHNEEILRD